MITRSLPSGDKGYCGAGFFTTPLRSCNPFHKYCKAHDLAYYISEQEYAKGVVEGDEGLKLRGLNRKVIADRAFYDGCRDEADSYWLIGRPFMRAWAGSYIKAVKVFSEDVWWESTNAMVGRFADLKRQGIELVSLSNPSWNRKDLVDLDYRLSLYK